ncbi:hypothetical protein OG594_41835 [Streptomyces sp. NBC_01214]|uniref:hypothetical protein n=1 Tax=Streptomyces sp. NBC_01214 TaxID=2903777 RepID=UPI0022571197|nr:hypothetical protein [Streptomyces sp. NBC_01214]MCX4808063.1 hypothetical protein [Streptomyces sp. NBC_01214]
MPDVKATAPIQQALTERGLKPAEHYLDSDLLGSVIAAAVGPHHRVGLHRL